MNEPIYYLIVPIIFMLFGLLSFIEKKWSKIQKIKFYSIFSLTGIVFGLFISALLMIITTFVEKPSTKVADGFTIESYDIKLNVNENNVVDVTETITVNFYEEGHHGIYRQIPTWLKYTGKNGSTESKKSVIENLKASGDDYTIESNTKYQKIKIGSADKTLDVGNKTYIITYQYDMGEDPYKGFDEFIFHSIGDYWGTRINNVSLEITMPKEIDENSIKFFADKKRKNDITSNFDYYISDKTIYANLSSDYELLNALTIDIELPDNYFIDAHNNYSNKPLVLFAAILLIFILIFILWLAFGKNYKPKKETSVEIYAPNGYDPATIGYFNRNNNVISFLSVSLIIELAAKKLIRIDELDENGEKIIAITNLYSTNLNSVIKRKVTIEKIGDSKKSSEKKILEELFPNQTIITEITNNIDDFYQKAQKLIDKDVIRITKDTINDYDENELKRIKTELENTKNSILSKLTPNEAIIYNQLFIKDDYNVITKDKDFYKCDELLHEQLERDYSHKLNDNKSYIFMIITTFMSFTSFALFVYQYLMADLKPNMQFVYIISFLLTCGSTILSFLMGRTNNEAEIMKIRINNYKYFLENATTNEIEKLVQKDPEIFYKNLSYSYVLNVAKIWIEKFKDIKLNYDLGSINILKPNSIDSINSYMLYSIMESSKSSSSSGSSSCGGGGCSSCGGGGSW